MMQIGAQMAGLDQCDIRFSYDNFLTSTPVKEKVCTPGNIECWERGDYDASMIPNCAPRRLDMSMEICEPDTDESYGGNWAQEPEDIPVSSSEFDTDDSYGGHWTKKPVDSIALALIETGDVEDEDRPDDGTAVGFAHIDSLNLGGTRRHVDSLQLPPLGEPFRANLTGNNQVQFEFTKILPSNTRQRGSREETHARIRRECLRQTQAEVESPSHTSILNQKVCHKLDKAHPDNLLTPNLISG